MHTLREYKTVVLPAAVGTFFVWLVDRLVDLVAPLELPPGGLTILTRHELLLLSFFFINLLAYGFLVNKKRSSTEKNLERHAAAIESSMDGIAIYNRDNEYVFVNQAYALINGYDSPAEIVGKTFRLAYDDQEIARMDKAVAPVLMKTGRWRGELIARRKNGSTYFQEASVTMLEDGGRLCIIRDITWRKRSEERMRRAERFLNTIFNSIRDPFCIFDSDFRIIRVNPAYAVLKNKRQEELIGMKCHEVLEGNQEPCPGCIVAKSFHSGDPCAKDKAIAHADGTTNWVEIYTYPILDEEGNVSHVMEYTRDITERKKTEEEKARLIEKLVYLSRTDSLTGLMNRRALTENLDYEIDRAKRYGTELSLILSDIDNFKDINDRYGHDTGDLALQMLSASMKKLIRKSDLAGRYGGDEFMLILPGTAIPGAESLADKILTDVRQIDFRSSDGALIPLSVSIGVAGMTGAAETIDSLTRRADRAMYASKHGGRSRVTTATGVEKDAL